MVLNVGTAHLGEFGSRQAIAETKGELAAAVPPGGAVVLNVDDPAVAAMAERVGPTVASAKSFNNEVGGPLTMLRVEADTETLVAELIREAALEKVRDELPHSITVTIDEMGLREGRPEDRPLLDVYASLVVERDSQKGIVIGHKGQRLKEVGMAARAQIAALVGMPVHLDLRVKVLKDWQRDPKHLNRLGF